MRLACHDTETARSVCPDVGEALPRVRSLEHSVQRSASQAPALSAVREAARNEEHGHYVPSSYIYSGVRCHRASEKGASRSSHPRAESERVLV